MIVIFNQLPVQSGAVTAQNPFVQKAATAAAEITNELIWLILN